MTNKHTKEMEKSIERTGEILANNAGDVWPEGDKFVYLTKEMTKEEFKKRFPKRTKKPASFSENTQKPKPSKQGKRCVCTFCAEKISEAVEKRLQHNI